MGGFRTVAVAGLLLTGLAAAPGLAQSGSEPPPLPAIRRSGPASLELDGDPRGTVPAALTDLGALVALEPLVGRLGGELTVGPLGESHELEINQLSALFGPGSAAMTIGEEIVRLSQPPQPSVNGLMVPLDLLEHLYAETLGYRFDWESPARVLISRRQQRDLDLTLELVHLQGVSTLVLRFSERPSYRVREGLRTINVEISGDRLSLSDGRSLPLDPLVERVEVTPGGVRIRLKADSEVQQYQLADPFRLVFDIYRSTVAAPAQPPPRPLRQRDDGVYTIVLDPGHGGPDNGAQGPSGSLEKDLTLQLALLLERKLEAALSARVVLTRRTDVELELEERTALANQNKADIFLSLHLNAALRAKAEGAETYFLSLQASDELAAEVAEQENRLAGDDPLHDLQLILWDLAQSHHLAESQRLAKLIQEEFNQALGLTNRGVKQAPFRVLSGAAMPAVLVEFGFLSNPDEEAKLRDAGYQHDLTDAVVRAVRRLYAQRQPASAESSEEELPR